MPPPTAPFPQDLRAVGRDHALAGFGRWATAASLMAFWPALHGTTWAESAASACLLFHLAVASLSLAMRLAAWGLVLRIGPYPPPPAPRAGADGPQSPPSLRRRIAAGAQTLDLLRWLGHVLWADGHLLAALRVAQASAGLCLTIQFAGR